MAGPTAKQDTNDKWRLCNIRQILFCTATTFRRATAAAAIDTILHRRRNVTSSARVYLLKFKVIMATRPSNKRAFFGA